VRLGSLCSGIGGLELGVERALGATTAWQAEIDPHASKVLVHRFPGVPNIGDVRDLSAMTPVDILTAGYPCQPFSTAGRRKGTDDPRHLWPAVHAAIAHLGPSPVVLENVRGHIPLGFDRVLGDLADIGYDAEWRVVRASDVGCCHQRARLFVAAYPHGVATGRDGATTPRPQGAGAQHSDRPRDGRGAAAAAAPHLGRERGGRARDRGARPEDSGRQAATDTTGERRAATELPRADVERDRLQLALVGAGDGMDFGKYAGAVRRQEAWHGPAPEPTTDGRLNPAFVEWMMGYPAGWVTDVLDSRNAALRCLGNAVVPQVAEAFCLGLMDGQAAA